MTAFQEVWSVNPTVRVGVLPQTRVVHGRSNVLSYMRPTPTTVPRTSANAFAPVNSRAETMVIDIDRILDPHVHDENFELNQATDEVIRDYDVRHMRHSEHVTRTVGVVSIPRCDGAGPAGQVGVGAIINWLQRLQGFMPGMVPSDPQMLYEAWCEHTGVQPVAVQTMQHYAGREASVRRLRSAFDARNVQYEEVDLDVISDRLEAASATARSYQDGMTALCRQIMEFASGNDNAPMLRTYLTRSQIDDLLLYRTQHASPAQSPRGMQIEPMPIPTIGVDIQEAMDRLQRRIGDAMQVPGSFVGNGNREGRTVTGRTPSDRPNQSNPPRQGQAPASIQGIRIPTAYTGRRALNLERQDEVRKPADVPDRGHADKRGRAGSDAGRTRRSLRLDD